MRLTVPSALFVLLAIFVAPACGGGSSGGVPPGGGADGGTLAGGFDASGTSEEGGGNSSGSAEAGAQQDAGEDAAPPNVCSEADGGVDCANPACAAVPLDRTVPTSLYEASLFLYEGPTSGACKGIPSQTGVASGVISPQRVAVITGIVHDLQGHALGGVTVTVVGHPELGQVRTAPDGTYSLAANGGGQLAVRYALAGYLPLQRHLQTQWNQFGHVDDAMLTPLPAAASAVTPGATSTTIVGTTATDSSGTRTPFVFVPAGTQASLVMPDGTTSALPTFHARIGEYTVGATGPKAMPADLPPTSAYTFCAAFEVDEADAQGATSTVFSTPLPTYLENYLGFPVGTTVPAGAYQPASDSWETSQSGVVLAVVGNQGGVAQVDTNGDGQADSAEALATLGITTDELTAVASRYAVGQQLWRVPLPHFSGWDFNWSFIPPPDAEFPHPVAANGDPDCSSGIPGSIVHCENRKLGEVFPIPGTGESLVYDSGRSGGRAIDDTINIQVTGPTVPASLELILLTVSVGGQTFEYQYAPAPNIVQPFTWNGNDVWGQPMQGRQAVTVTERFVYAPSYGPTSTFGGYPSGSVTIIQGPEVPGGAEIWFTTQWTGYLGSWNVTPLGFGGWSLSDQNIYDPIEGILYLGTGGRRSVSSLGNSISSIAGTGSPGYSGDMGPASGAALSGPHGIAVAPDGTAYFSDELNQRVRRIATNGVVTTIAGTGTLGFGGDGGPATSALFNHPMGLALGPDGSLYVADSGNARVRRIDPSGNISTYAGSGTKGLSGDGGPATAAEFSAPHALAMGPNGALYVTDGGNQTVRVVTADGVANRVAGNGTCGYSGDGAAATAAEINDPLGITVASDGTVYIAEWGNNLIRRVSPSGIISTFAGSTTGGFGGDGGPAASAAFSNPHTVDLGPDGSLYVSDEGNRRVRRIDASGIVSTIAGLGSSSLAVSGPPLAADFQLPRVVYVHTDGSVWIADYDADRILRFSLTQAIAQNAQYFFPSADGKAVYAFDSQGRQLLTIDAETGVTLRQFAYDATTNLLTSVADAFGNTTSFAYAAGCLTSVTGPFGAVTSFACDANDHLRTATDPTGAVTTYVHSSGGLLTQLTTPRGNVHTFSFDAQGLLQTDGEPWGGSQTLATSTPDGGAGTRVTDTTAQGRASTFDVIPAINGGETRTVTDPAGIASTYTTTADGKTHVQMADGSLVDVQTSADPRFGMMSPLTSTTVTLTLDQSSTVTQARAVTLATPGDPIHASSVTETTSLNGANWVRTVNNAASTVTLTSPVGRTQVAHLGPQGQLTELDLPNRAPIVTTYDSFGRPHAITQSARATTLTYGSDGYLSSLLDPLAQSWTYAHDGDGRLVGLTRPDLQTVGSSFYADGDLETVTPPGRGAHVFQYLQELPQSYVPPLWSAGAASAPTTYAYSADVDLLTLSRADGQVMTGTYDSAGRLATWSGDGAALTYAYSPTTGQLQTVTNQTEKLAIGYYGPFISSFTWSGDVVGNVTFVPDPNLRLGRETAASTAIAYVYDADGLPTTAGNETIVWNATDGSLTSASLESYTESYGYDATYGETNAFTAAVGTTALYGVTYMRDALGRISTRAETIGGATTTYAYTYDGAQRLATVSANGTQTASYTYDANGNRSTGTEVYDGQDRLTQKAGATYTYSAQGELQSKSSGGQVTSYTYDGNGALRGVTLPNGTAITYVIDGAGRRVGKKVNGALSTGFFYRDARAPVVQLDATGAPKSRFVYGTSGLAPDYMVAGCSNANPCTGPLYRLIKDERGSVRLVVNASTGAIAERIDYDEWGVVTNDTAPGFQPFGYAGGLYDSDTGLVRMGARDYDPSTGRWTNKDPTKFAGGANLYLYANGDPIDYVDPSGTNPVLGAAIGFVGGAVLGGGISVALQLASTGCIDWGQPGVAALEGGIGGAILGSGIGLVASLGEAAEALPTVATPYGTATQELTAEAQAVLADAQNGGTLYRQGSFGVQQTTEAQFWSPSNPAATPGYAGQMGMPGGAAPPDWIMGGTLEPGGAAVTRAAPGLGANAGGAIEVVTPPGGVSNFWFHMPD